MATLTVGIIIQLGSRYSLRSSFPQWKFLGTLILFLVEIAGRGETFLELRF